jgi:hypothetical protein
VTQISPARSRSFPLTLGALAVLGLVGCAIDPADTTARSEGPLAATPDTAQLGRFEVGGAGELSLQLDNGGRSEVIIRRVSLIPPDPYTPRDLMPEPCVPPDPYHNPPGFRPAEDYLTTRLIAPCVKPGGTTTLALGFTARDAGGFAAGIQVEYATSDGGAFTLTVPATACAVAR